MSEKGEFNMARAVHYRPNWQWQKMRGGRRCLQLNLRDLFSLEAVLRHVRGRRVAVQAGGNLGLFPKRLAEEFEIVYTFEPDQKLFEKLLHNAPETNIVAECAALGNSDEKVSLGYGRRDGSGRADHEGLTHISGPGSIRQVRIDDLGLSACDLIYLDIEGYELNALRGAEATVVAHHPVLAVEVNGNINHYGSSKQELRDWIESRGYEKVARLHGDDVYVPTQKE